MRDQKEPRTVSDQVSSLENQIEQAERKDEISPACAAQ